LIAYYKLWPGNRAGRFSKETIGKGVDKQGKSDEKG